MSSGPFYALITDAYTSLSGEPTVPRRIFHAGDSIQINLVHQMLAWEVPLPPVPLEYRAIAILQNAGQAGFFQRTDGEAIYQLERGVFSDGTYEDMASMITFFDLGPVPADPLAAYDAAFAAARAREDTRVAVIREIANGENGIEFMPGLWSYQPILVLRDPAATSAATATLDYRVWYPWYYFIQP